MATHLCRNSSAGIMAQRRMSKLLCRNFGRTFAAEILSPVNYGNNTVPKFTYGKNYGKTPAAKIPLPVNYGNSPVPKFAHVGNYGKTSAAIIQNVDVSTAFLRTQYAQGFSQRKRSAFIQSLSAEFRHRFCHLPHILAFGILALVLTKFVREL